MLVDKQPWLVGGYVPRVARPEFANRISTNVSDAELSALERIADKDGAPVALVVRRFVREGLAREAGDACDHLRTAAG